MNPAQASTYFGGVIAIAAGKPFTRAASERHAAFWSLNCENLREDALRGYRDSTLLSDRLDASGAFLRKQLDGSGHVRRQHLAALFEHQKELSKKSQIDTRFCAQAFDWMA